MLTNEQIEFVKKHTAELNTDILVCEVVRPGGGEYCLCEVIDGAVDYHGDNHYAWVQTLSGAEWFFKGRDSNGLASMSNEDTVSHGRLINITLFKADGSTELVGYRCPDPDELPPFMRRTVSRLEAQMELEKGWNEENDLMRAG